MRSPAFTLVCTLLCALLCVARLPAQSTTLASLSTGGHAADGECLYPEISPDGRWLVFQSSAATLVPGDTNGAKDIFVRDLLLGTTVCASPSATGAFANGDSLDPDLSDDGRFVTFFSYATDLVAGDTNEKPDIFVRDLALGTTLCASVDAAGVPWGGRYPSLSADGRFVAFDSKSEQLVPFDTNGERDVFVHDCLTGATVRVSVASTGRQGDGDSRDVSLSPDGRFAAFESLAGNLVDGDTNGVLDVFVHDLQTGVTVRASVSGTGAEGNGESGDASLSESGHYVAFSSYSDNLVSADFNWTGDVFVRDLQLGTTVRASIGASGLDADGASYDPTLTDDGRFLVCYSEATNLVLGDTNNLDDIFLCDLTTNTIERVSVSSAGQEGDGACLYSDVSADGRFVVFDSLATNLAPGDANAVRDVFVRDLSNSFATLCAGDGSLATPCPCGHIGAGGRGCPNSSGSGGARLEAAGATAPDSVHLLAWGLGPNAFALFLQGDAAGGAGVPFGDGVRCVGGNVKRLFSKTASGGAVRAPATGDVSLSARSAARGDVLTPGSTRYYDVYYRDPNVSFCPGATFNVTNAVRVNW